MTLWLYAHLRVIACAVTVEICGFVMHNLFFLQVLGIKYEHSDCRSTTPAQGNTRRQGWCLKDHLSGGSGPTMSIRLS